MIWMYERGAEVLRIETRFDAVASRFALEPAVRFAADPEAGVERGEINPYNPE